MKKKTAGMVGLLVGALTGLGLAKIAQISYPLTVGLFSIFHLSWTKVAYLTCVGVVPFTLWKVNGIAMRIKPRRTTYLWITAIVGAGLVGLIRMIDWRFYYLQVPDQLMTYLSPKTYALAMILILVCWVGKKWRQADRLILVCMVGVAMYMANFAIINELHRYNANALNLSVVMTSVIQVFFGKAVLIDQKSQYGLYAHFLEPILHLMGGVSVLNFSLIMAGMVLASVLSIGIFLWLVTKNKWIALVGFLATLYFNYFVGQLWPEDLYYQYYPIRTLFPTLLLPLYYWYSTKPGRRKYWLLWITFALGTLWNLDVGIFTFAALGLTHLYREGWGKLGKLARDGLSALGGAWGMFFLFERMRYGTWPQVSEILSAQKLFLSGAELHLNGLWILIVLIYLMGVVILKFWKSEYVVLVTTLGIGIFTYYLNNPHDSVLTNCGYPAIILLTLLVERAWRQKKLWWPGWMGVGLLCLMAASSVQNLRYSRLVGDTVTIEDVVRPETKSAKSLWGIHRGSATGIDFVYESDLARDRGLKPIWVKKAEYADEYKLNMGEVRDDVLILSNWDYLLYLHARARAPLPMVNFRHLALPSEWEELFTHIAGRQSKLLIVDEEQLITVGGEKSHVKEMVERLWREIRNNYHVIERELVGEEYYGWQWQVNYISTWERNEK
ncbi:MAG: hypothetical protein ABII21_04400 [bacterium]